MPELSNLLRQRLGALTASWVVRETPGCETPPAGGRAEVRSDAHPDPDTLTAYTEQLLPQDERNLVMNHLAACRQCREVVMLSLPEAATAPSSGPVALPAVRRRRLLWTPGFGLAASAVALAAVVGVLIEEFPRKSATPGESAKQEAPSIPAQPAVADSKPESKFEPAAPGPPSSAAPGALRSSEVGRYVAAKPPAGVVTGDRSAMGARKDLHASYVYDVRPNATPAGASAGSALPPLSIAGVVGGERRDYVNDKMFSDGLASDASGITVKDLPMPPTPRVMSPAGMFNANNNATQLTEFAGLPTPTPSTVQKRSFAPVGTGHSLWGIGAIGHEARALLQKRPTVPIPANGLGFSAMGGPGQLNPAKEKSQSVEVAAVPPITSETDLDRSSAFTRRARSETAGASYADASHLSWKVAGGKLLKSSDTASWTEGYPSNEGIEFAAFAAHGADVWAGGRDAALFHSPDAGANWERLTLGASASGTIIRIEANGLSVRVKSSSGQSWLSTDGGKSWTRQD